MVELVNGGLVRGTISESIPNSHVTIVTLTGEVRRFEMTEVSYAGPTKQSAPAVQPAVPPTPETPAAMPAQDPVRDKVVVLGQEARVSFQSRGADTLHLRQSSALVSTSRGGAHGVGYSEVCTAPCRAAMPAGTHTFALSTGGGAPVAADPVTLPPGESTLAGDYKSRSSVRTVGWVIAIGGTLLGYGFAFAHATDEDKGMLYVGAGLGSASLLTGLLLVNVGDTAEVRVTPGIPPQQSQQPLADVRKEAAQDERGLRLSAHY
jgi:hypothetical protein